MYDQIAGVYDLVKAHRNYASEAEEICKLIYLHKVQLVSILEVACGTGSLLAHLQKFDRTGLDLSVKMLEVAKQKLSEVKFIVGDMKAFDLARKFDVVLCLDGAIGYNAPGLQLRNAIGNMVKHINPGGMLLIEPWYEPSQWQPNRNHVVHNSNDNDVVVRMAHGLEDGSIEFHSLIGNKEGITHIIENHRFWLHEISEVITLIQGFGMTQIEHIHSEVFRHGLIQARKTS